MDKNLLVCCVTFVCCIGLFSSCEMHSNYRTSQANIAAANAGLEQEMVKAAGFDPKYLWVARD